MFSRSSSRSHGSASDQRVRDAQVSTLLELGSYPRLKQGLPGEEKSRNQSTLARTGPLPLHLHTQRRVSLVTSPVLESLRHQCAFPSQPLSRSSGTSHKQRAVVLTLVATDKSITSGTIRQLSHRSSSSISSIPSKGSGSSNRKIGAMASVLSTERGRTSERTNICWKRMRRV